MLIITASLHLAAQNICSVLKINGHYLLTSRYALILSYLDSKEKKAPILYFSQFNFLKSLKGHFLKPTHFS